MYIYSENRTWVVHMDESSDNSMTQPTVEVKNFHFIPSRRNMCFHSRKDTFSCLPQPLIPNDISQIAEVAMGLVFLTLNWSPSYYILGRKP